MAYQIKITRKAQKELSKINRVDQNKIIDAINNLSNNPMPNGYKKLSGRNAYRIRISNYRDNV